MAKNNVTDAQKMAYQAGKAYGVAKAGGRVPCRNENKDAFRAGVKSGKAAARNARNSRRGF